jgi:hypothetical protein
MYILEVVEQVDRSLARLSDRCLTQCPASKTMSGNRSKLADLLRSLLQILIIIWKPQQLKCSEEGSKQAAVVGSMFEDRLPLFDPSLNMTQLRSFCLLLYVDFSKASILSCHFDIMNHYGYHPGNRHMIH